MKKFFLSRDQIKQLVPDDLDLETPAPCAFEKVDGSHEYQRVDDGVA